MDFTPTKLNLNQFDDFELINQFFASLQVADAEELAVNFINWFPTLGNYKTASQETKQTFLQEQPAAVQSLMMGIELGIRTANAPRPTIGKVLNSQQIGEILVEQFQNDLQENLCLLCVDVKHRIISQQVVFTGTLTTCPVHPREIFAIALEKRAQAVIVMHNHPSGSVEPSENDLEFSKRLAECGELLGIELLDSFIVGHNDYLSMRETQLIEPSNN